MQKIYLNKHAIANIVYANVMHNEMIKNVIVNVYIELRLTAQKHSGILFMLSTVVKYEMKYSLCIKNAKRNGKYAFCLAIRPKRDLDGKRNCCSILLWPFYIRN